MAPPPNSVSSQSSPTGAYLLTAYGLEAGDITRFGRLSMAPTKIPFCSAPAGLRAAKDCRRSRFGRALIGLLVTTVACGHLEPTGVYSMPDNRWSYHNVVVSEDTLLTMRSCSAGDRVLILRLLASRFGIQAGVRHTYYVHDPGHAVPLGDPSYALPYLSSAKLPSDGVRTGYMNSGFELMTAPSATDKAVFIVDSNGRAEQWPRREPAPLCG